LGRIVTWGLDGRLERQGAPQPDRLEIFSAAEERLQAHSVPTGRTLVRTYAACMTFMKELYEQQWDSL
jgi:hypothetical protein